MIRSQSHDILAEEQETIMKRLVEIRSYKLQAGATVAFQRACVTAAVPLLRE
jgi:hypothetical protein